MHTGSAVSAKNVRLACFPLASSWQSDRRMLDSSEIIHWTLYREDRRLICVERLMPSGSECSVLYNGLPVAVRVLPMGGDVDAWAAEVRNAWESAGWITDSCDAHSSDARAAESAVASATHRAHDDLEESEDAREYPAATARLRIAW